jgi:hypothetical protein
MSGARPVDLTHLAITGALCAAVLWRGLLAHRLGELWWCCLSVAVAAVLGVDAVATGLDGATQLPVSGLLGRLAAVSAAALAVRWLLRHGDRPERPSVVAPTAVIVAPALIVTWLLGTPTGSPDGLATILHWVGFAGFLLAALVIFLRRGLPAVDGLPAGRLRVCMSLLLVAAAALFLWLLTGTLGALAARLGLPVPAALAPTMDYLLTAVFGLFAAGVLGALMDGRRGERRFGGAAVYPELVSLRTWLTRSPAPPHPSIGAPGDRFDVDGVLDLVVEIRDRFHELQRFLTPGAVAAAAARCRRARPSGVDADAWTAAVCLELAMAARLRREPAACAGADLSALGGGDTVSAEAEWLARVSYARRAGAVGAFA